MSIIDLVRQHVGPNEIQQIASQLGIDPSTATRAVDAAIPGIAAGVAQQAPDGAGAGGVGALLGSQGGLLGGLGSLMSAGGGSSGNALSGILGQHADTIANSVQQASGLDAAKVKQLLALLAPMVMAAIARHGAGGATGQAGSPLGGGMLGNLLDRAQGSQ